MRKRRDRLVIVLSVERKAALLGLAALAVLLGGAALADQLTLTTSYPVPSGVYNQLITTGNSGTVPADTTLNRSAGNTILVPPSNAAGRVGVKTASPVEALDVAGGVRVGWDPGPCSSANQGSLRWNKTTGRMETCTGTFWGSPIETSYAAADTVRASGSATTFSCPGGMAVTGMEIQTDGSAQVFCSHLKSR
jgi:hypothetical protein